MPTELNDMCRSSAAENNGGITPIPAEAFQVNDADRRLGQPAVRQSPDRHVPNRHCESAAPTKQFPTRFTFVRVTFHPQPSTLRTIAVRRIARGGRSR
jgi:hypothetical protein